MFVGQEIARLRDASRQCNPFTAGAYAGCRCNLFPVQLLKTIMFTCSFSESKVVVCHPRKHACGGCGDRYFLLTRPLLCLTECDEQQTFHTRSCPASEQSWGDRCNISTLGGHRYSKIHTTLETKHCIFNLEVVKSSSSGF